MPRTVTFAVLLVAIILAPARASAQINFHKNGYYVAMGDSVAAGEGALPVTNGYAYQLYDHGAFGRKQAMDFANVAIRGGRSWDLLDHQVPQVLCAEPAQRPSVVTITAGANDFLRSDTNIVGIAQRVAGAISLLLNNDNGLVSAPVLDPVTSLPCRALGNVTILVSNYYSIPHPVPAVFAQLDAALSGFDQALRFWLQLIPLPAGSRVAIVDLYSASLGQHGLTLVERRLGFQGPFDFEIHRTRVTRSLPRNLRQCGAACSSSSEPTPISGVGFERSGRRRPGSRARRNHALAWPREDGPLWYRGLAQASESVFASELDAILLELKASATSLAITSSRTAG
jgi:hypothetical protein